MLIKTFNILAFAAMIVMNYLANALPINGKTTGQLSDQYPNLFVPAGMTFSIWGVIYLLLLGFVVTQFNQSYKPALQAIGWLFVISCLLNCLWIVTWHYDMIAVSMLIMIGLLVSLVFIAIRLQPAQPLLFKLAFGIYLGWICIATIANMTALLVDLNWTGWGLSQEMWAIIMVGTGTTIALLAAIRLSNPYVGLAVAWALLGIALKRQSDYSSIMTAAIVCMALVILAAAWILYFRRSMS